MRKQIGIINHNIVTPFCPLFFLWTCTPLLRRYDFETPGKQEREQCLSVEPPREFQALRLSRFLLDDIPMPKMLLSGCGPNLEERGVMFIVLAREA